MKRLCFFLLAVVVLSSSGIIFSSLALTVEDTKSAYVVAYYFHGTMRCPTCHKLEQYSKEVIETNFKDALVSGKLEFKAVNVEERGNEHFAQDYQLYTKSLILSLVKDGKEIKSKNLTKIWEYVSNKQKFFDYVSEEVNNFLKEAQ
ncbi:MAG: nitrophenyl compound nitroreductase subunit ArsF family protein [Candidatus Omnitrophota bacterium]